MFTFATTKFDCIMNTAVSYNLKPYTREELIARAEEGRRQIAMGNYLTNDEVFREIAEELGIELPVEEEY